MKYLFLSALLSFFIINSAQAQLNSLDLGELSTEQPDIFDETLVLKGQISAFEFNQPQTRIILESDFESWELIAPSAVELRRLGWTSKSLFAGELVEVEAVRQLGVGERALNLATLTRVTRANGALLLASLNQTGSDEFQHIAGGMYSLDSDHAQLRFTYDHMGFSKMGVDFERINSDVLWNAETPESSIIQLDIDASAIRSGVTALDQKLQGADFFDSRNHPRIQFRSTQLRLVKWDYLQVDGLLQIKDVSRPIQLEARINKIAENPLTQKATVGMSVSGTLKRSDWGLNAYLPAVDDLIELSFEAEYILRVSDIPSVINERSNFPTTDLAIPSGLIAPDKASDNAAQSTR